jgi:hypothetical protein
MIFQERRSALPSSCVLFVYVLSLWWLTPVHAQEIEQAVEHVEHDIPPNSHYSTGDQGWACNKGFAEVGGLCVSEDEAVPGDGTFEFSDGQWRCRSGFHRAGKFCAPGVAPVHAAFVGGGDHWECDWGYQRNGSQCQEVKPPPHAYVAASGHEWLCFPGYARVTDHCAPTPNTAPRVGAAGAPTPPEETPKH